jgi:hypothetical protein
VNFRVKSRPHFPATCGKRISATFGKDEDAMGKREDKDQKEIQGNGAQKGRPVPRDTGKGDGRHQKEK